jgi:tetratricopeptide (TPR) repeat protein
MRQQLLRPALLLVTVAVSAAPLGAQGRYGTTTRVVPNRRYTEAAKAYSDTLKRAQEEDSTTRARALFSRSYAVQQVLAADSAAPRPADTVLADYLEARVLDSTRYYAAASHNAGTLLRQEGRHREAVGYYLDATRVASPSRPVSLYSAAREYEALERPDSAALLYRAALASHPGYTEARLALLRLYARPDATDSLLAVAERWTEPEAAAPVNDAILQVLTAPEGSVQQPVAERLLTVLARNLAAADMDPQTFGRVYRQRVEKVAAALPGLAPQVQALADCYRPRGKGERYDEPAAAKWWTASSGRGTRAETWSATLRQVGDRYYRVGEEVTAASYYEAALDYPDSYGPPAWADLGALLPLGVIYLHRSSAGGSPETIEALDRYINFMFMGKGERYGADDIRQVRAFHMALGELFAQRGEWSGKGPRNVIFQLERMRWATRRLQQERGEADAFDPPELLERLATAYQKTGQPDKARAVVVEARDAYRRLGRPEDAARLNGMVDTAPVVDTAAAPAPQPY